MARKKKSRHDIFISPLHLIPPRKKRKFILNLNIYQRTYYKTLNNMKIYYKKEMEEQIKKVKPYSSPIYIAFVVYKGDNRHYDVSNICCVHDKFFDDAIVELGRLDDDNSKFVISSCYLSGGIDTNNPRVEIHIFDDKTKYIEFIKEMLW